MISIIIAVKDNKFYTEKCFNSIFSNTKEDYELIVVDNASGTEMQDYLLSLGSKIKIIRNQDNQGCAFAWNQGIEAALGNYICVANNDIIVPENWLCQLKQHFDINKFGLISPCMREGEFDYDLEKYNKYFKNLFKGKKFVNEYRGVCLFTSRQIFDIIGYFDQGFRIGKFEDEDFFLRLNEKGLTTAVFSDIVVHHYGSKTIIDVQKQNNDFEQKNREYFKKKWKHKLFWRKLNKIRINFRRKIIKTFYNLEY